MNNIVEKSKVIGVLFKTNSEFKEKMTNSESFSLGMYYTYEVLLKVGSKYITTFEINH